MSVSHPLCLIKAKECPQQGVTCYCVKFACERSFESSMQLPMVDMYRYCLEDLTTSWTRLIRDVIIDIVSVDVLTCLD